MKGGGGAPQEPIELWGEYFAPLSAQVRPAVLRLQGAAPALQAALTGAAGETLDEAPLTGLTIEAPLVGLLRRIEWPSGGAFVTPDHAGVEALARMRAQAAKRGAADWVRAADGVITRLESRWSLAVGALVLTLAFAGWVALDGIPRAAALAAQHTPPGALGQVDTKTMELLDENYFQPSKLSRWRRQQVERVFKKVRQDVAGAQSPYTYRLQLRRGDDIGANAFALPGGTVVVTDELVSGLYQDLPPKLVEQALAGVLAHEVAHVEQRHSLAGIYKGLGLSVLTVAVTGDLVSAGTLAVAAPTFLIQQGYSRRDESAADEAGGAYLLRTYGTTEGLQRALLSLEGLDSHEAETAKKDSEGSLDELLYDHPDTFRRVQRLAQMEAEGPDSTPR